MSNDLVITAVSGARSSGPWVRVNCPLCASRRGSEDRRGSLGFRESTGYWHCFRCNARGFIRSMATGEEAVQSGAEHVELPREFIPLWCDPAVSSETFRPAIRYLARRGVRRSTCEATSVGACAEGRFAHRIVVPIEDDHGSLVGVVARTWGKGEPPYLNSSGLRRVLWNVAVLDAETDAPVLVVEGLFDALPHYPHAVACLGKPTHAHLDRLARSRRPVVMCLDGDARDEAWARAMQLRFYGVKTGVVLLDAGTDPNEYSTERLLRQAAESLRPGNL